MDNIEALLKERGLTKTALSELLGVKKQNLNGMMKNPTLETINRFASVLDVPTWKLFVHPGEVADSGITCPCCGAKLELKQKADHD